MTSSERSKNRYLLPLAKAFRLLHVVQFTIIFYISDTFRLLDVHFDYKIVTSRSTELLYRIMSDAYHTSYSFLALWDF